MFTFYLPISPQDVIQSLSSRIAFRYETFWSIILSRLFQSNPILGKTHLLNEISWASIMFYIHYIHLVTCTRLLKAFWLFVDLSIDPWHRLCLSTSRWYFGQKRSNYYLCSRPNTSRRCCPSSDLIFHSSNPQPLVSTSSSHFEPYAWRPHSSASTSHSPNPGLGSGHEHLTTHAGS